MLCQVCAQAAANIHITEIVDGEKKTLALCEACAGKEEGVIDPVVIKAAAKHLKKILEQGAAQAKTRTEPAAPSLACPHCGITWNDFRKSSRFGCTHDYDFFGPEVERLLLRVHGAVEHAGRMSERAALEVRHARRREALRRDLDAAIRAEDYERAATLRDRLHELEERNPEEPDRASL